MFSPISRASSLPWWLVTVVPCRAQFEQPAVQNLWLVQLPLMLKQKRGGEKSKTWDPLFFLLEKCPDWHIKSVRK